MWSTSKWTWGCRARRNSWKLVHLFNTSMRGWSGAMPHHTVLYMPRWNQKADSVQNVCWWFSRQKQIHNCCKNDLFKFNEWNEETWTYQSCLPTKNTWITRSSMYSVRHLSGRSHFPMYLRTRRFLSSKWGGWPGFFSKGHAKTTAFSTGLRCDSGRIRDCATGPPCQSNKIPWWQMDNMIQPLPAGPRSFAPVPRSLGAGVC